MSKSLINKVGGFTLKSFLGSTSGSTITNFYVPILPGTFYSVSSISKKECICPAELLFESESYNYTYMEFPNILGNTDMRLRVYTQNNTYTEGYISSDLSSFACIAIEGGQKFVLTSYKPTEGMNMCPQLIMSENYMALVLPKGLEITSLVITDANENTLYEFNFASGLKCLKSIPISKYLELLLLSITCTYNLSFESSLPA